MRIRRIIAVLATAALAFWTPSIVPIKAYASCGYVQYQTIDTAYAAPCAPLPTTTSGGGSPWPAVVVIVGAVGVIVNAAYVWNTQCRELSSQEAMTSTFLPFVGIALDAHASKCHR